MKMPIRIALMGFNIPISNSRTIFILRIVSSWTDGVGNGGPWYCF